jgi:glycosyltransferase involved in cell wall biosynthesis
VVFPPLDEDYGYVTLEAMLSSKAVVTCKDSGGPLEFVEDELSGLVADGDAAAMADALDRLWADRALARRLGEAARARYDAMGLGWERVVECLLA